MSVRLTPHSSFSGRPGPVVVVVADGVGVAPAVESNAVTSANTPTLDSLTSGTLYTELFAHGTHVGLPSDADIGNSEVGHNALGAGRIFDQGAKLINKSLQDGSLVSSELWQSIVTQSQDGTLHFLGLHSDGNVHSHNEHLYALLREAATAGISRARVHILLDGRDVPARSALDYIATTETVLAEINAEHGTEYAIASGGGRMNITMDRYEADWDMVKRGYDCHTHGVGRPFSSATEAVETMYSETTKGDQYLDAFVVTDSTGTPLGKMNDGDAVVLYNFRGDRAIEISRAYEEADFTDFDRGEHPNVLFVGMLQYDGDAQIPKKYLVNPPVIDKTLGEYLCAEGLKSFAVSETQKFGHVTYFWNGNRSGYLNEALETYIEVPSDNIEFNEAPAMKAKEIVTETTKLIASGEYQFGRINLPNGDMVGHTGDLDATIVAMEAVDQAMTTLIETIQKANGVLIYTADHGNADSMFTEKDGVRSPKTSHTLSKVPFAIYDPSYRDEYQMVEIESANLGNVAATVCVLLGFESPADYNEPLIIIP